jgi:hypothetical protein
MRRASSLIGSSVRSRASSFVFFLGLACASTACGTRYARVPLQEDDDTKVVLRAELRDGKPFDRGFHQPATISGVRLAHVLAQIDVRVDTDGDKPTERQPAIPTDLVYPLGDALSKALAQADPSQEVVVQALRRERRLGLFTQAFATSFVAFVGGDDLLHLQLSRIDWPVPKGGEDELREPVAGREVMAFRVLASEGVDPTGHQSVAVHWQDDRFRNPTTVRVGPGGKMTRRTVLMEEEAPAAEPEPAGVVLPTDPDALRALADLEEARRSGAVTEAEYQRQRRALLKPATQ